MFDEKYYKDIWKEGVHRHDYCEGLANQLVQKYGKVRYLDLGCGCGYLVKLLREKGCDAWGLEISAYAIANSCDPAHVRLGDIRDIPFPSGFDVVHSQGVWGYFPKEDIQKAWAECKRVGKQQEHNIDCLDYEPSHRYLFTESAEWWKDQFYPKVLVACPNHELKEYAFQRWIDMVRGLTYPNFEVLVVDNSPNDSTFMSKWQDKIPIIHIDTAGIEELMVLRLNLSYERIRQEFLSGKFKRLMILESDVIAPANVIETMLEIGGNGDWISHAYPDRTSGKPEEVTQGMGCTMFSRELMETFGFEDMGDNYTSDGGLWGKVRPDGRFKTMELWGFIKNKHLAT